MWTIDELLSTSPTPGIRQRVLRLAVSTYYVRLKELWQAAEPNVTFAAIDSGSDSAAQELYLTVRRWDDAAAKHFLDEANLESQATLFNPYDEAAEDALVDTIAKLEDRPVSVEDLFFSYSKRISRSVGVMVRAKVREEYPVLRAQFDVSIAEHEHKKPKTPFLPTALQTAILNALDGIALTKQELANTVCKGDGSALYKKRRSDGKQPLPELVELGKVANKRGRGFFRPDAPPK